MSIHHNTMPDRPPTLHFMTYVAARYSGKFKVHQALSHAKNALTIKHNRYSGHPGGVIWEWNEAKNVWVEIYRVNPGEKVLPWNGGPNPGIPGQ